MTRPAAFPAYAARSEAISQNRSSGEARPAPRWDQRSPVATAPRPVPRRLHWSAADWFCVRPGLLFPQRVTLWTAEQETIDGGRSTPPGHPAPARILPARAIAVDASEAHHDGREQNGPSQDRDQPFRRGRQSDQPQDQRQHDYSRDRHDDENDPPSVNRTVVA